MKVSSSGAVLGSTIAVTVVIVGSFTGFTVIAIMKWTQLFITS